MGEKKSNKFQQKIIFFAFRLICIFFLHTIFSSKFFIAAAPDECKILIYTDLAVDPSEKIDRSGSCPENGGTRAFVLDVEKKNRFPKLIEASPSKGQRFNCLSNKACKILITGYGLVEKDKIYVLPSSSSINSSSSSSICPPKSFSTNENEDKLLSTSKTIDVSSKTIFGTEDSSLTKLITLTIFYISPLNEGVYTLCYASNLALKNQPAKPSDLHYYAGKLVIGSGLLQCNFEKEEEEEEEGNRMCGFKLFKDDSRDLDLSWKIKSGSAYNLDIEPSHDNTPNTGPSYDHTKGIDGKGYYLYMKSPGYAHGAEAILLSPLFIYPSGVYCVKLFFHMYGDDVNSIRGYVRTIKNNFEEKRKWGKPSFVRIADHGDEWIEGGFEFNSNGIDAQQIIIQGLAGYSEKGDLAIDDLSITKGKCPSNILKDSQKDFICGEVRLNTGSNPGDKSWYLEGAVSCAGRGYSFDELKGDWSSCCIPNYGNYTVVLKDKYGDGWSGSIVEFKFFDEIITFGNDFNSADGSQKKYSLVVGLLQITRAEGKNSSIGLEVTVMIPNSHIWCGVALLGSPPPTIEILKKYGIRSKEKAINAGDKLRLVIKNEEEEALTLRPNQNYEAYCYAESLTNLATTTTDNNNNNNEQQHLLKMDNAQVAASRILVTTDSDAPILDIDKIEANLFDVTITFSINESGTVYCSATENITTNDENEEKVKKTTINDIKIKGSKRKIEEIDVHTAQKIIIKKLMPDTKYTILCFAEDTAYPEHNGMSTEAVKNIAEIITTKAKAPKITIQSYKTFSKGFSINVKADTPCKIYCGAAMAGSPYPSKEDVKRVGATAEIIDTNKSAILEIRGVPHNTRYTIYCHATSRNGNMEMSETEMLNNPLEVTSFGKFCEIPTEPKVVADGEATPFDPITAVEEFAVREYMISQRGIGLDGVYRITLYIDKAAVLRHYDEGAPMPKRYARVRAGVCQNGQGYFQQYKVGPLGSDSLNYELIGEGIPTECGGYTPQGVFGRRLVDLSYEENLNELLKKSFGYDFASENCKMDPKKCLEFGPVIYEKNNDTLKHSYTWVGLRTPDGEHVPFYFVFKTSHLNMTDPFKSDLRIHFVDHMTEINEYWYNGESFSTLDGLIDAYNSGKLKLVDPDDLLENKLNNERKIEKERRLRKIKGRLLAPVDIHGPNPEGRGGLEYRAAPEHIEPQGKRFTVKVSPGSECYTIDYVGWHMTVHNDRDTSLRIWNLRFNEISIAFELGVMDALAHYTVAERNWFFLDSWYGGLGTAARKIQIGIECATTGILLFLDESLCIFEQDFGRPIRSHWKTGELRDGAPHHALILRQILTVSNYDYVTDYIFHVNGAFEGTMSFTGELYAGVEIPWFSSRQESFGTQVTASARMGGLHTHDAFWKIDFDIGSSINSIAFKEIIKDPLRWGAHKLHTWLPETEQEAYVKHNSTRPLHYFVIQEDHSVYNNTGGYYVRSRGALHIPQSDYELYNSGPAELALFRTLTTVRKDDELEATLPRDNKYPNQPAVHVGRYIADNESVRYKDLVTWISDGIWHIPLTEDMPLTLCLGNTLGWFAKPANFFTEDPSMDLHNAVAGDAQDPGTCAIVRNEFKRA